MHEKTGFLDIASYRHITKVPVEMKPRSGKVISTQLRLSPLISGINR
jgi:hypothetical protein